MKNIFFIIIIFIVSCRPVVKTLEKSDTLSTFSKTLEVDPDTLTYTVPNIIFKDTVITRYNKKGSEIQVVYTNGVVDSVSCILQAQRELINHYKSSSNFTSVEKESSFITPKLVFWSYLLLVIIGIVFLILKK